MEIGSGGRAMVRELGAWFGGEGSGAGEESPESSRGLTFAAQGAVTMLAEPPSRRAAEPPSRRAAEPPSRRAAGDEFVPRMATPSPSSPLA